MDFFKIRKISQLEKKSHTSLAKLFLSCALSITSLIIGASLYLLAPGLGILPVTILLMGSLTGILVYYFVIQKRKNEELILKLKHEKLLKELRDIATESKIGDLKENEKNEISDSSLAIYYSIKIEGSGIVVGSPDTVIEKQKQNAREPKLSILAIFNQKEDESTFRGQVLISSGVILYIAILKLFGYAVDWAVVFIPLICSAALQLNRLIQNFRVSRGSYLTTEVDARRLISFILQNSKDIDFKGPGGDRHVMSEDELLGVIEQEVIRIASQGRLQGI